MSKNAKEDAIDYLLEHGGALVGSSACSEIEIADARVHGRMWVTEGGLGIVARLPKWLAIAHERSEKAMKAALVLALLVLPLWASAAHAQTDPRLQPQLQPGSLVYVGTFKVPDTDGIDWQPPHQFTWTSIGVAGSAGPSRLFFACHAQVSATLGIVEVPALGGVAKVIEPCRPMPNVAAVGDDPSPRYVGGAMVYNGRTCVSAYIYYDGAGLQKKSHWCGPSLTQMAGPWLVRAENVQVPLPSGGLAYTPAGMIAGWMGHVPTEWQPLMGGPAFTGLGAIAITSRSSYGPAFSVFDPAKVGTVDPLPATMLIGYPDAHRNLGEWGPGGGAWRGPKITPYYSGADELAGMFWAPGTRSIVSIGRHGTGLPEMAGDNCYGPGTNDPAKIGTLDADGNHYCFDPSTSNKGPHSYRYQAQAMAYDAVDLLAVKAGTKKPWDMKPYAVWNFGAGTPLDKPGIRVTGMAYDASTSRLYVSTGWTDVYVFDVKTGTPPPPPPPPPVDCQGVWSESLSDPTPLVCDATRVQTRTRTKTFTVTTPPSNGGAACPASPVITTETNACEWTPPPPPPVPSFTGLIRAQEAVKSTGALRLTLEVPKAQTVPAKGAAVDVPLPGGTVVHGTVYALSTYANGNWRVTVTLPNTSAIGLTVEVPSATVASLDADERLGDYRNTVVRWQQDVSRAKVELGVEGKWSYDPEAARFSGGWSNRSYYLWRVDTAPPNDGVAVVRLDSPAGENSTWALSVAPGDCLPDEALPGWRCGLDLVDLNRRYDDRQIVAYGDQLFSLANWQGAGTPTPLVKVTQQPGHVVVRVDPRCSRTEWGATCPPGADE